MIFMNVLVVNSGSSSLKFKLINVEKKRILSQGIIERIGGASRFVSDGKSRNVKAPTHKEAVELMLEHLGPLVKEIDAVGHRVVHGGEMARPVKINKKVLQIIEKMSELAPLHNPANLKGIKILMKKLKVPQVAVFDTAFHRTMPQKSRLYGLDYKLQKKYNIQRYGFHGTSHKFVSREARKLLRRLRKPNRKIVTCHLGNGSSVTAVLNGRSFDTSMGFTPLEGVMMGTRSGTFDPSIVEFLTKKGFSVEDVIEIANHKSGLLGISGVSNDMRDVLKSKSKRATLAVEMFVYLVAKQIGAYAAAMNGLDAVVFTAGIGENSAKIREMICKHLEFLGVKIDKKRNSQNEMVISSKNSKVAVLVIPTNEELQIAMETAEVLKGG